MLPYGRKNPLPFPSFGAVAGLWSAPDYLIRERQEFKEEGKPQVVLPFCPPPWVRRLPAAGAATLPPSADGESPAEVQRKPSRPLGANTPAAVRAPHWVGAEKEPPRQDEHANAVRMPRSPGAEKPCRRFVHRHIKAKPRFPSVFFFICGGANRSCDRLRGAHRPDGFRCPT